MNLTNHKVDFIGSFCSTLFFSEAFISGGMHMPLIIKLQVSGGGDLK